MGARLCSELPPSGYITDPPLFQRHAHFSHKPSCLYHSAACFRTHRNRSLFTASRSDQGTRLPISWKYGLNITALCATRDPTVGGNFCGLPTEIYFLLLFSYWGSMLAGPIVVFLAALSHHIRPGSKKFNWLYLLQNRFRFKEWHGTVLGFELDESHTSLAPADWALHEETTMSSTTSCWQPWQLSLPAISVSFKLSHSHSCGYFHCTL